MSIVEKLKAQPCTVVAKSYTPGIGEAVADRTINRVVGTVKETWSDVADRVALGNTLLLNKASGPDEEEYLSEFALLRKHLRKANLLMSGRHLQHGDENQPNRNMEVFTNCSTSPTSANLFHLLLNGSGVGRSYDDCFMVVDWSYMPNIVCAIDSTHEDVQSGEIRCVSQYDAKHLYESDVSRTHTFVVPDTREGWAQAVERIEWMTFQKRFKDDALIIDFSQVRPRGTPIMGMQGRPASGPGPLISAIENVGRIKHTTMPNWRKTLYVDHYLAECVLVGGARRAARMSTKTWRDKCVLDFIRVKENGHLWSSNNSVTVDSEFWSYVGQKSEFSHNPKMCRWAHKVFNAICEHSYYDNSGEPGIINVDKLVRKGDYKEYETGKYFTSAKYSAEPETKAIWDAIIKVVVDHPNPMIVNPCGEVPLSILGGFCVIADWVPYHSESVEDAEEAIRAACRALIRVNQMESVYNREVKRTNRIGIGFTGLFEYAWKFFGFGFRDLIDEEKSIEFWKTISYFRRAIDDECEKYSKHLGVAVPHTNTVVKPAGTTSKLFGLTEGAHLPSMREYIRWVQFRNGDPLISEYRAVGYPIRELKVYKGSTIVGFPTQLEICKLGMGDKLVIASEATPEEQYQWLHLLEKYWINGVDEQGNLLESNTGGQVSYTLKYNKRCVSFEQFAQTLYQGQSKVRCCSVLPDTNAEESVFEYLPEQAVSKGEYELILQSINSAATVVEDIGKEHVDCANGACPVDFNSGDKEPNQGSTGEQAWFIKNTRRVVAGPFNNKPEALKELKVLRGKDNRIKYEIFKK